MLLQWVAAFHDQFVAALSAAGNAYAGAEAAASNALGTLEADAQALMASNAAAVSITATAPVITASAMTTCRGTRSPLWSWVPADTRYLRSYT